MASQPPPPPPYSPTPITVPPTSNQGFSPLCARGLEMLAGIDQLRVKQDIEHCEVWSGWETCNRYRIFTNSGQNLLYAVEESDSCSRQCGGPSRDITLRVLDLSGREIISMHRPYYVECMCSTPLTQHELTVWSTADCAVLGYVTQVNSISAAFQVFNGARDPILNIEGPAVRYGTVPFQILSLDRQFQVGQIVKEYSGTMRELFTDADNFHMTFPMDLDINIKAILLGALFVIDYTYFERR